LLAVLRQESSGLRALNLVGMSSVVVPMLWFSWLNIVKLQ